MKQLLRLAVKAKYSPFYKWLLNQVLWRVIPFNRTHRIRIVSLDDESVCVELPYIRSNQNHLKGLHACALATLSEYACGIGLMTQLDPSRYRIILKDLRMEYHAQGKESLKAHFRITQAWLNEHILNPLTQNGSVTHTFTVSVYNSLHKPVCTAHVTWQLKAWDKVRTKA